MFKGFGERFNSEVGAEPPRVGEENEVSAAGTRFMNAMRGAQEIVDYKMAQEEVGMDRIHDDVPVLQEKLVAIQNMLRGAGVREEFCTEEKINGYIQTH